MRRRVVVSLFLGLFLMVCGLHAGITWNVTFNDVFYGTNVGFDDPALGGTRQATFMSVFSYINTVVYEAGTVDLLVNTSQTDGGGSLASCVPYFPSSPAGFANGYVFDHATGVGPWGSGVDATATFDFGYTWNADLGVPTSSEYDLFSISLHEVTHALGFLSRVQHTGLDAAGHDPGVFTVYNSFLEMGDGRDLFGPGGDFRGTPADLTSNDVWFNGLQARAANGGSRVQVYAPASWRPGSSIGHIQGNSSYVMQYLIGSGTMRRSYTAAEIGILGDIGWTLVPEPGTAAAFLFGITLVVGHRRPRAYHRAPRLSGIQAVDC